MDEVIPGLWIGNLPSALDVKTLKENNIFSILSAMRGRITIHETFIRHQIHLDDTEDADILVHFLPAITFIQTELDKGRGVLVHCQAGMSRSVTIVASYLMYSKNIDVEEALELIMKSHPNIAPNESFLKQLEIFHQAKFRISRFDKTTRMFYMERTVEEVLNGDGSLPDTDMFAKFPRTPGDSAPATPGGPRRKIRCKMCRQELATREHMLDHGQLGPPTPAMASPAISRRPSENDQAARRPSMTHQSRPRMGSDTRPRRPSGLSIGDSLMMSSPESPGPSDGEATAKPVLSPDTPQPKTARAPSGDSARRPTIRPFPGMSRMLMDSLSMSALEIEDDSEGESTLASGSGHQAAPDASLGAASLLGRRLSDAVLATPTEPNGPPGSEYHDMHVDVSAPSSALQSPIGESVPTEEAQPPIPQTHFANHADLSAQLYAHPTLSALRMPMGMTPISGKPQSPISPPILANPKCSGYFLEPMKWMEPFLEGGQLAGKIMCPNKKCGVKLGNYDWAGVCCSCKEWVVPGFCIHRSKVDEIV